MTQRADTKASKFLSMPSGLAFFNGKSRCIMTRATAHLGFWSGIACAVLSAAFTVLMILDIAGVFHGTLQLVPVLLLAPCFVALVACIDDLTPAESRLWSRLGLSFSVIYAAFVSFNYLMQLTVVPQNPAMYKWLAMEFRSDSMFGALELLGYSWQCLALLALAPLFAWRGNEAVIKAILVANGILALAGFVADVVTGNPMHPAIILSLGFWCLTFPIAMALIGLRLHKTARA
jgi:hypothetical protein